MANGDNDLLIGEIKGKLDLIIAGQDEIRRDIATLNTRLGKVEVSGAKYGATAGLLVAVGLEFVKNKLGM